MEASKEKLPDDKDASELKSYFEKVYPELDFDRVYASDLKKMVKWYSVLSKNQVEIKLSEPLLKNPGRSCPAEVKEEKPVKKAAPAKSRKEKQPKRKNR